MLDSMRIAPQARSSARKLESRARIRPSSGALIACVKGTPKRAGPMMATVSSVAATPAP